MSDNADIDSILEQAIARHEARDLTNAGILYRDVLRADPDNAEGLNLLGVVLQDQGQIAESLALIERAVAIDPDFPDAHANLARGHRFLGDMEKAVTAARKAIALDPDLGEAWLQLGYALLSLRLNPEALVSLRKAVTYFPDSVELRAGIGFAAQCLEDHAAAADAWRAVLRVQPDRIDALVNLGAALGSLDQLDEARELHLRAVALAPDDGVAQGALAVTLHKRFEAGALVTLCQTMLTREPERLEILMLLGSGLTWLGRFDEARAAYLKILAIQPDHADARWQMASLATGAISDEDLAEFRARAANPALSVNDRAAAGYMAGKSLDQTGAHDAAFLAYKEAAAVIHADLRARHKGFDPGPLQTYTEWARAVFTPTMFAASRSWGHPSELPVFIVGMPRSGTSLIEQIAASHPRVFGAGERKDITDIVTRINRGQSSISPAQWDKAGLRQETTRHIARLQALGGGADRVIDKLPDNSQFLGQIAVLFPNARIIIAKRDPRDVCVSCFTTHFGDNVNWSYDLEECATRAVQIEQLMEHWRAVLPADRVLEISYETMVANLESESRRLIAFLGLEWDPACLDFHTNKRQVTTASVQQVRKPVYDSSMGRWRRYKAHLGPMLAILAGHFPLEPDAAALPGAPREGPEAEPLRRGIGLLAAGDHQGAILVLRDVAARFPALHAAHENLGMALNKTGDFSAAVDSWQRAAASRPSHPLTQARLGYALSELGRHDEAIQAHRRAVALAPEEAELHRSLGASLWRAQDVTGAREAYALARELAPDHAICILFLGHCERALGHDEAAIACYRRVLALNPEIIEARAALIALGETQTKDDIATLRAILEDDQRLTIDRIWAGFGLGQAWDKAGEHDAAFAACRTANAMAREHNRRNGQIHDQTAFTRHVDRLIAQFPAAAFLETGTWGDPSDLPVFVVGLPESGIVLVERMLTRHPRAVSMRARGYVLDTVKALDPRGAYTPPAVWDRALVRQRAAAGVALTRGHAAARMIAATPDNLQWLGHIAILWPKAKIIMCDRDSRDLGLSCYFAHGTSGLLWSNDLNDIAAYIADTERLIAHWRGVLPNRFLDVRHETLMLEPDRENRRLTAFLGLDQEAMPSWTDLPFHGQMVGCWRQYQRYLGPLAAGAQGLKAGTSNFA